MESGLPGYQEKTKRDQEKHTKIAIRPFMGVEKIWMVVVIERRINSNWDKAMNANSWLGCEEEPGTSQRISSPTHSLITRACLPRRDTGSSLDTTVGDGQSIESVSWGDEYHYCAVTPPAVHATEEYLAEKWGIPRDKLCTTNSVRVTCRQCVTQHLKSAAEDQKKSRRIALDDPEAAIEPCQKGDNAENSVGGNIIMAGCELEHWHLPAVDQNVVKGHSSIENVKVDYSRIVCSTIRMDWSVLYILQTKSIMKESLRGQQLT
ncbi:hypothetical protein C8R45DRAFT_941899 [Mycena sanguinolenta]|nr:hypothetical protein C8R45DRAFT_941899 [Mycena sanguinolenta]